MHTNLRNASSFSSFPLPPRKNTNKLPNFFTALLPRNGCGSVEARSLLDSGLVSSGLAKLRHHGTPVAATILIVGVFLRCRGCIRAAGDHHPRLPVCSDGDRNWGCLHRSTAIPGATDDTKGPNPKAEDNTAAVRSSSCVLCIVCCVEWSRGALHRPPHEILSIECLLIAKRKAAVMPEPV